MGRPAGWMQKLTGRGAMRSPGAPSLRNEIERLFWVQTATGITSEKAAQAVGVSTVVGTRWFRHRGGMPLFMSNHISGRYLSFAEREEIGLLRAQSIGVREISRRFGRSPSTISRVLTRNAATRCGRLEYRASDYKNSSQQLLIRFGEATGLRAEYEQKTELNSTLRRVPAREWWLVFSQLVRYYYSRRGGIRCGYELLLSVRSAKSSARIQSAYP